MSLVWVSRERILIRLKNINRIFIQNWFASEREMSSIGFVFYVSLLDSISWISYLVEKFPIFMENCPFFHQILGKNNWLPKNFWGKLIQKLAFYSPVTAIGFHLHILNHKIIFCDNITKICELIFQYFLKSEHQLLHTCDEWTFLMWYFRAFSPKLLKTQSLQYIITCMSVLCCCSSFTLLKLPAQ